MVENGVSTQLGQYLRKLNVRHPLLVTDSVIVEQGIMERVRSAAMEDGIQFSIYQEVLPEPPERNVNEALELYRAERCDGVVGLGGGSAMDVAKAVAMLVTNSGSYSDYVGIGKVPIRGDNLVLMPTTSGTGSEVSVFSIMLVNGSKAGVVDENISANIALVDPLLTISVPRRVTASTGLDAFCHHLESLLSTNASPLSDAICLEGIRVISRYLRKAVGNGTDPEARYWMSYASTIGGFVMNLTDGAAANHGLAFALGAKFHVSHGLSNAVMLPYVFPVIASAELEKVRLIGQAMGEQTGDLSDRQVLATVTSAITELVRDVGCLIPLSQLGVTADDLDDLVTETDTQIRVMKHSTYRLTDAEIYRMFQKAL